MWRVRRIDIVALLMRVKIWLDTDLRIGSCVRRVSVSAVLVVVVWYCWCNHDGDVFGKWVKEGRGIREE